MCVTNSKVKARQSRKQITKKRTKLIILCKEEAQDSEFCSFFGRIDNTINCFRDLLTFRTCNFTVLALLLKNTKRFEKYLVKMLEHGSFQFNCDFQKGFSPIVSPLA